MEGTNLVVTIGRLISVLIIVIIILIAYRLSTKPKSIKSGSTKNVIYLLPVLEANTNSMNITVYTKKVT